MTVIQSYCGDYNRDPGESSYHCTATHPPCEHGDGPCAPCNELTELEAEIENLHSRLKDLHERHRQARATRNLVHNGPLIQQFPPEIVAHIFVLAFPPREAFSCHNPGKEVNPLILTGVCQSWRELALSTSTLWSTISVDAEKPNFPLLNHKVTHSGVIPLSIHLFALSDYPNDPSALSKEAMSLLVQQLHRTSSLCLNLPKNFITEFSSLSISDSPNAASLLEEIHVHCRDEDRSFRLRLAIEPPHPRHLLLEWLPCDQIGLNWRNISHLTLKSCYVGGALSEILVSRDLKHLTLEVERRDLLREQTLAVYPSIEDLTLRSFHSAEFMFMKTTLPSLLTLEIKVEEKRRLYPMIRDFLHRSQCPLQVLTIHHWGKDTTLEVGETSMQALIRALENMTTLQHLTLESYEGFPASSPESLVRRLSSQESAFLPCLQTLSLRTRFTLPIDLLLKVMTTDGLSSEITSGSDTVRPLRRLNLELWMTIFDVGPFSRDDVLQIIQLRAAGKIISIGCAPKRDPPELLSDVVKYWECKYGL